MQSDETQSKPSEERFLHSHQNQSQNTSEQGVSKCERERDKSC